MILFFKHPETETTMVQLYKCRVCPTTPTARLKKADFVLENNNRLKKAPRKTKLGKKIKEENKTPQKLNVRKGTTQRW